MAKEVFIPKLGQTVEEVTLVKWLVADGSKVEQGQEILEVETDKAVFPVEAAARGVIHIGPYAEGQVVPVLEGPLPADGVPPDVGAAAVEIHLEIPVRECVAGGRKLGFA